jgi:hypothetical protein
MPLFEEVSVLDVDPAVVLPIVLVLSESSDDVSGV